MLSSDCRDRTLLAIVSISAIVNIISKLNSIPAASEEANKWTSLNIPELKDVAKVVRVLCRLDTIVFAVVRELITPVISLGVTEPETQLPMLVTSSVEAALLRLLTTAARLLFRFATAPGASIFCKPVMILSM